MANVRDWTWSSFHRFVGMGEYVELCATERWEEETRELTPEFFTELTDRINPMGFIAPTPAPS